MSGVQKHHKHISNQTTRGKQQTSKQSKRKRTTKGYKTWRGWWNWHYANIYPKPKKTHHKTKHNNLNNHPPRWTIAMLVKIMTLKHAQRTDTSKRTERLLSQMFKSQEHSTRRLMNKNSPIRTHPQRNNPEELDEMMPRCRLFLKWRTGDWPSQGVNSK